MAGYADFDTLIDDLRLARVEEKLRQKFPTLPGDSVFVTFIQPVTTAQTENGPVEVPDLGSLAVISRHPRKGPDLMTQGQVLLTAWREAEWRFRHLVGLSDPALLLYAPIVRSHLESLQSLRELMN